jgi:CRP-like cAMP-binding protein
MLNLLARCHPLHQLDKAEIASLMDRAKTRDYKRGQMLLRSNSAQAGQLSYLLAGSVELRRSFFDRQLVKTGDELALQPLDYLLLSEGGQIVALDDCTLIQISREAIDRSLAACSPCDYSVASLSETDLTEEYLVSDGAVAVDWMSRFLQSSLAQSLPAQCIQQLLGSLVTAEVAKGQAIVRRGELGDAMYVVTRGAASVYVDDQSLFHGREIVLLPGDYFGEESLVADTLRNATVVMETDGVIARLDRKAFDKLVRPHLIREADDTLMERCLTAGVNDSLAVIDVRFPVEFRRDALPASTNIPISLLRARLSLLDKTRQHVVTRAGGRRSELAVFLLRQAGFDAYLMASSDHHFASVEVFARDSFVERIA